MIRLAVAAVLAVAVHAGLLWVEMPLTRPALSTSRHRQVDIHLMAVKNETAGAPTPRAAPDPPKTPPVPQPRKRPPVPVPKKITPSPPPERPSIPPFRSRVVGMAAIEPLTPMAEKAETPEPTAAPVTPATGNEEPVRTSAAKPSRAVPEPAAKDHKSESAPLTAAKPLYKYNAVHGYPSLAQRRGYEGTVLLDVLIGVDGRVKRLRVDRSSGYGILDRSAMADVKQWRFEPARRGPKAVEMWVQIPIRYELK